MNQRPSAPPAGRVEVDAFDPAYGAAFGAEEASDLELSCEMVEDGGAFLPHRATVHDRPYRLAFVDGTMRTEARLTLTDLDGEVSTGLAGSWAVGASSCGASNRPSGDHLHQRTNGGVARPVGRLALGVVPGAPR